MQGGLNKTWQRFKALFQRAELDRDLQDEVCFHLAMREEKNRGAGMEPQEARCSARRQFGNVTHAKESSRAMWTFHTTETLWQDVRFGLRTLRKNPGFTLIAVLTLGLGIGANAAIFSMAQGFLLKPVSLPNLDRLVAIGELQAHDLNNTIRVSPANYLDWVSQARSFDEISGFDWEMVNLSGVGAPLIAQGIHVSPNFFEVTGTKPLLGRTFAPEEDHPGYDKEIVLTRGLWERQFGSDSGIVGKTIRLNSRAYTVIGVMDSDCKFPQTVDLWMPLALEPQAQNNRQDRYLQALGRLRPGVAREQAAAELKTVARHLSSLYPQTNHDWTVQVIPLRDYAIFRGSAPFIYLLMGTVGFVLLIACANVANLLFARASGRRREIGLRTVLGASRWRVARQLLSESLLLGLLGAGAGLLLAEWGINLIRANMPPELEKYVAGWDQIRLDGTVFLFALLIAVFAGVFAGLFPALQSWRPDLNTVLKEGARNASDGRSGHRLRNVFVVAQLSLALLLMIGAALMVRGFRGMLDTNDRFHPESLLTLRLVLPDSPAFEDRHRRAAFADQTLTELATLPGVRSATLATGFPYSGLLNDGAFAIDGRPVAEAGEQRFAVIKDISPNYFETLGAPIVAGRGFSNLDGTDSPAVALVSERLARAYWPHGLAIGHRVKPYPQDAAEPWRTIVGVVADIKYSWPSSVPELAIYRPYAQAPQHELAFGLRTAGDPSALFSAARYAVARVSSDQPIFEVKSFDRMIRDNTLPIAYVSVMMSVAGILALALAAVGVYGVMAYSVAERTHEIGVRVVLGAQRREMMRLVVGRGLVLILLGCACGLPFAFGLAHLEANLLAGVSAKDFWTFSWGSALLAGVALLACYIPARRAMRVDPLVALRHE